MVFNKQGLAFASHTVKTPKIFKLHHLHFRRFGPELRGGAVEVSPQTLHHTESTDAKKGAIGVVQTSAHAFAAFSAELEAGESNGLKRNLGFIARSHRQQWLVRFLPSFSSA